MDKITVKDHLNLLANKTVMAVLPPDEALLWSGEAHKTNKRGKMQVRNFVITTYKLYNINIPESLFSNWLLRKINRAIRIESIRAVTYSALSNNFVLHVPSEYDYYLCSPLKDEILEYILYVQHSLGNDPIKFFLVEDIDLTRYSKTDSEVKDKWPTVPAQPMTVEAFVKLRDNRNKELENNVKNTEVIITRDGEQISENSFEIIRTLGRGYFGRVFLVEKKDTKVLYALKVISKADVIKKNGFQNLKNEKKILQSIQHPFLVNLEYFFASPSYVFFAMKFKQGGELYHHLKHMGRFPEPVIKFYACQVILGLEYLHSKNIMYRDMKPENILLDEHGNACLADFGISKVLEADQMTMSFVGTPEYVAPEILHQKGHNKNVDIWCFGVLLYEMAFGTPPFYHKNQNLMLKMVIKAELNFPKSISVSEEFTDLITKVE